MASRAFLGTVVAGKAAILTLGIPVLTLGLYSHFQSTWVKLYPVGNGAVIPRYQICDLEYLFSLPDDYPKCPSIALEQYFVIMIIICFVLSLLSFITGLVADLKSGPLKWVDFSFHLISAVMLAVASGLYIYSGLQVSKYVWGGSEPENKAGFEHVKLRKLEKVAAGILTTVQALLYGVVAFLIGLKYSGVPG